MTGGPLAFSGFIQLLVSLGILAGLWASPSASEFFHREPVATTPATPPIPSPPRLS